MTMVVTPEAWTVIGTGVVVLIAIATSYRHLRAEMKALRDEFRGEMHGLRGEVNGKMDGLRGEVNGKIDGLREEMNGKMHGLHGRMDRIQAEIGALRERMAKLEGLLEGLREAITGRKVA